MGVVCHLSRALEPLPPRPSGCFRNAGVRSGLPLRVPLFDGELDEGRVIDFACHALNPIFASKDSSEESLVIVRSFGRAAPQAPHNHQKIKDEMATASLGA